MARKTAQYRVMDEGRDKGKLFLLTEMSAAQGEAWAMRVLLALMGSNVQLPEDFEQLGMAALAELGLKAVAGLKWEIAEPLLNEMLACVQIIPDPTKTFVHRELIDSDIEEISTRLKLRVEAWNLHISFLQAVAPFLSGKLKVAAGKSSGTRTSAK